MKAKETCGKRRYATEYDAGKRLSRMIRHAEAVGHKVPLRYYYHAECGGFHLTSRPDKEETSARVWYITPGHPRADAGTGADGTEGTADQDEKPQSRSPAGDGDRVGV